MSGLNLSRLSKIAPNPAVNIHRGGMPVAYTCHAAALHWGYMDLGFGEADANQRVTAFARAKCEGCLKGGNHHFHVNSGYYGEIFCWQARQISRHDLLRLEPGDLLITGHPSGPVHSMIVRQVRGADHVTIRGFNNWTTLGTGVKDQYDPVSHNITKDKYWRSNEKLGREGSDGAYLYVVPYRYFSNKLLQYIHPIW